MSNSLRILIVDDEPSQRSGLSGMITAWGMQAETAEDGTDALQKLEAFAPDVIITDLNMPGMDGFELLQNLQALENGPLAIVLTAFGSVDTAVKTVHDFGAYWFLEKPVTPSALEMLVKRAASHGRLREENRTLETQLRYKGSVGDLVGSSGKMQELFSLIQQVGPSKACVLITGESGTGKELVARALHRLSPRKHGPFIAINCAALPETLIESELFGHEKGAFTGATERHAGCFELAQGGTLLLDEIGEMPPATQAKLLRILEDSRVRRLGGKGEFEVDVRVLAATNRQPEEAVRKGSFREDLFYRLNVFHLHLPPLRERKEDIPPIADAMIAELNKKHECRVSALSAPALNALMQYNWPGNVRELRNVIERAVIVAGQGLIERKHLPSSVEGTPAAPPTEVNGDCVMFRVGTTVEEAERGLILRTLEHTGNNKTRAAEILGISLKTLHNKLKEYATGSRLPAREESATT